MRRISQAILSFSGIVGILGLLVIPYFAAAPVSALPVSTNVADFNSKCSHSFFGLEPWYQFINSAEKDESTCDIKCFNVFNQSTPNDCPGPDGKGQTASDLPPIGLAIVDDLLRIAGIVAIGYVIYGAVQYITSQGNPDATSKAQQTIINALIGLTVTLTSVGIVSFLGSKLGG